MQKQPGGSRLFCLLYIRNTAMLRIVGLKKVHCSEAELPLLEKTALYSLSSVTDLINSSFSGRSVAKTALTFFINVARNQPATIQLSAQVSSFSVTS